MHIIQRPRVGGKTFELVKAFRSHGSGIFLVATLIERDRIIRGFNFTPEEERRVVVASQACLVGKHAKVFCDNLDWVVSKFLGSAVDVATVNGVARPTPQEGDSVARLYVERPSIQD